MALTAQFDLNCPRPQLRYQHLGDGHWGVVGCGKRARYRCVRTPTKAVRSTPYSGEAHIQYGDCHWVLDSPVMRNEESVQEVREPPPGAGSL